MQNWSFGLLGFWLSRAHPQCPPVAKFLLSVIFNDFSVRLSHRWLYSYWKNFRILVMHGAVFANGSWRLIPKNTVSFFPLHLLFVAFSRTHDSFLYIDAGWTSSGFPGPDLEVGAPTQDKCFVPPLACFSAFENIIFHSWPPASGTVGDPHVLLLPMWVIIIISPLHWSSDGVVQLETDPIPWRTFIWMAVSNCLFVSYNTFYSEWVWLKNGKNLGSAAARNGNHDIFVIIIT